MTTIARTTIARTTTTNTVTPTTAANLMDDDEENPFIDTSSHGLGDDQDSAVWTSSESELGAPLQNRKEARDVRDFFSSEKGLWYCKYCTYVFHLFVEASLTVNL
jgi:hypothetical protein